MGRAEEKTRVYAERLAALDTPEMHAAARKIQMHFRASKLRGMMGVAGVIAANVHQQSEERTMEERSALVQAGLAIWLWEKATDEEGKEYYYNTETAESRWDEPEDEFAILMQSKGSGALAGVLGAKDIEEWEICDDGTGRVFYYNARTGESQWEKPAALLQAEAAAQGGDPVLKAMMEMKKQDKEAVEEMASVSALLGGESSAGSQSGTLQLLDYEQSFAEGDGGVGSLGSVWEECQDDDGKVFWFNTETQESTWRDPRLQMSARGHGIEGDGSEWEVAEDEEGRVIYVNQRTGESTYERPDGADPQPPSPDHSVRDELEAHDPHSEELEAVGTIMGSWEFVEDDEGNQFWYNNADGTSQWTRPAG